MLPIVLLLIVLLTSLEASWQVAHERLLRDALVNTACCLFVLTLFAAALIYIVHHA